MDKIDIIDQIQKKPYWLIDVLPKQVPAGSAGQYFKAEQYFLSWLDEISWKFARVLIRQNCYYDLQVSTDGESWAMNESPGTWLAFSKRAPSLTLPFPSSSKPTMRS